MTVQIALTIAATAAAIAATLAALAAFWAARALAALSSSCLDARLLASSDADAALCAAHAAARSGLREASSTTVLKNKAL